jgi:hypothetical protein
MKRLNKMMFFMMLSLALPAANSYAECVAGTKSKTTFRVIDGHNILLSGGYGPEIFIKTFDYFNQYSRVEILMDSFCDYQTGVLYIDGRIVNVNEVKVLR